MSKFFSRVKTKLGGAVGTVQRTEYDRKILDGTQRYETMKDQYSKLASDVKDTTPTVGGLSNNEKLSQVLKQTANLYGSAQSASKSFTVLADALNAVGQSERQLFKQLNEACHSKYETFMKTTYSNFKKEKKVLDDKALDMDGAKDKNQKKPSNDNKLKEQAATNAYVQQRRTCEGMINEIPTHDANQAAGMKAYCEAMLEHHKKCQELLSNASHQM